MRTSHGDVQSAIHSGDRPGAVERCFQQTSSGRNPGLALFTGTCQRADGSRVQIDAANQMVLCVGDIQQIADQSCSLRPLKFRLLKTAVPTPGTPTADHGFQFSGQAGHHNPIVIAVGDEQSLPSRVRQHFAGVTQRGGLHLCRLTIENNRSFIQGAATAMVFDQLSNHRIQQFPVPFPAL